MTKSDYVAPLSKKDAFQCPHCGVFAHQYWGTVYASVTNLEKLDGWLACLCNRCNEWSMWRCDGMVYPDGGNAPAPNPDLPDDIKADYEEARGILNRSPRGAAALLRLAIQKLCKHLGQPGKNIDKDIAALVQAGLSARVQKMLDTVRVVGNEAVHPGTIDLRDDPALAGALFRLVNMIVEKMISEPLEINELYEALPEAKRDAIEKRDGK